MSDLTPSPRSPWIRRLLFGALVGFLVLGPFYRQVMGGKSPLFRNWIMFAGYGLDICTVQYEQMNEDGTLTPLNRLELLGYESLAEAPRSTRRLKSIQAAESQGRRICQRLDTDKPDVRLFARCASRKGWRRASKGTNNLCANMRTKKRRSKPLPTGRLP